MELFVPFVSAAVALALIAVGFLVGCLVSRLGRSRASHVVFLPADRPIPVDSESYERGAEDSKEATSRPKRFRWVTLGVIIGMFLQFGLLSLLGVAPKFCELRGWSPPEVVETSRAEHSEAPELPVLEQKLQSHTERRE